MAEHETNLPHQKLGEIKSAVLEHFKSLNAAGKVSSEQVSREDALKALGFSALGEAAEQWLCAPDSGCSGRS